MNNYLSLLHLLILLSYYILFLQNSSSSQVIIVEVIVSDGAGWGCFAFSTDTTPNDFMICSLLPVVMTSCTPILIPTAGGGSLPSSPKIKSDKHTLHTRCYSMETFGNDRGRRFCPSTCMTGIVVEASMRNQSMRSKKVWDMRSYFSQVNEFMNVPHTAYLASSKTESVFEVWVG